MLDLEVTRRCNLRCDYCFVGWSRGWSAEMPEAVAREVIREGAGRFSTLHITGGEPLAYRPLPALVELGARLGYEEILINTNGTLLGAEAVSGLAAHRGRLSLAVSLDGPEELHDRARGAGRFREAAAGIRRALAAGIRVTAMTVVTPEVLKVLGRFLCELRGGFPGLSGVTLFPVGVGPEGSQRPGASLRPLSPAELVRLALMTALIDRTVLRVGIGAYPIANPLLIAFGYPRERLYQCEAGRGRVCVHADLGVSSCHPVKEPIYGRWRPGLLSELEASPAHGVLAGRRFPGCGDCEQREVCGHCRAFVAASGAGVLGNDFICHEVLRETPPAPSAGAAPRSEVYL